MHTPTHSLITLNEKIKNRFKSMLFFNKNVNFLKNGLMYVFSNTFEE